MQALLAFSGLVLHFVTLRIGCKICLRYSTWERSDHLTLILQSFPDINQISHTDLCLFSEPLQNPSWMSALFPDG
ncbi:MAG: hypothetical protein ACK53K_04205 [Burkholderiales bacterium]|jgi:hypothetical protein